MLVIFGVGFDKRKKVVYALPDLFGIGLTLSKKVCRELDLAPNLCIENLTESQQYAISKKLKEDYYIENNLRELIKNNVQNYILNGSVRGFRHKNHLPVRGQRTHTNAKTPKRVIMGIAIKK